MKHCIQCGELLELDCFYKHPSMADGRLNKCKKCCCKYAANRRVDEPETVRSNDRRRAASSHRKAWVIEFQRIQRQREPEKYAARNAVSNAIRDGKLTRQPCKVCGSLESEAHHEDYSKPLDVVWLCFKHHREIHGQVVL